MEVEFNWRMLFLLLLLAAVISGAVLLAPHFAGKPSPTPTVERAELDTPQKIVANPIQVQFQNDSSWQVNGVQTCLPQLKIWLGDYPLKNLTVIITDTVSADMALGVTQSSEGTPDAKVKGKCEEKAQDELTCFIAVMQGEPSANLDVAVTVGIVSLIQDFYRPRTKDAWKNQIGKDFLTNFQPLIAKENGEWISNCLHLTR